MSSFESEYSEPPLALTATSQERNKLLEEKTQLTRSPAAAVEASKIGEIDEELERVENEAEILSETIQARQEEVRYLMSGLH